MLRFETAPRFENQYGFQRSGLKTGVENAMFWSEIGSGFGEPGGTPPPMILRSTAPSLVLLTSFFFFFGQLFVSNLTFLQFLGHLNILTFIIIFTKRFYYEYCWLLHDVTTKLSILRRVSFHGVIEQLKTNFQTNFRFKRVLGFVIEYA